MTEPFLKIDRVSLTLKLKAEPILKEVSFEAYPGEVIGIIGRNGSGKSMLFKCIAGLVLPQHGEILVGNIAIISEKRFPPNFGALIEKPGFINSMSAFDNLKVLASIQRKIGDLEIMESLRIVGLEHVARKRVYKFSTGMKQRLGIAQAVMEKPKLLLLDEPSSGLDEEGFTMLHGLVKQLKEQGVTILLTSHIQEDIMALSDRVFKINNGLLAALGEDPCSTPEYGAGIHG